MGLNKCDECQLHWDDCVCEAVEDRETMRRIAVALEGIHDLLKTLIEAKLIEIEILKDK